MLATSRPASYRPLAWRRELLHLIEIGMEAVWCIPVFIAFAPGANRLPFGTDALFVIGNLLIAMGLVRYLNRRQVRYEILRWIILAGVVGACAFALTVVLPTVGIGNTPPLIIRSFSGNAPVFVPFPVLTIGLVIFLWYRGISIATALITPVRASFGFRLGILVMILLAVIPDARFQSMLVSLLPLFFFMGLMATSLARSASLRINRDLQRTTFGARWIGLTGIIGAVITAVGFVGSLLLAGYGVEGAAAIIKGIMGVIFAIFLVIMAPILLILEQALRGLAGAIQSIIIRFNPPEFSKQFQQPTDQVAQQNAQQLANILDVLKYVCMGSITLLIVVGIVVGLFILLRNRATGQSLAGEEREQLDDNALNGLRDLLRRGLLSLQNAMWSVGQFGLNRRLLDALTIRRLYARLIANAAERGYPRDPSRTPFEYQDKLRAAFPGFDSEIGLVTQAYVNVHYGELPDNPDALAAVKHAVDQMIARVEEKH